MNIPELSRRNVLGLGIAACLSKGLFGCANLGTTKANCPTGCKNVGTPEPTCPIAWAPNLFAPVFYGVRQYPVQPALASAHATIDRLTSTTGDAPDMRVYYPSLDSVPNGATILLNCERFPLVLFIHGACAGDPYLQWIDLPAQLARSGYVVAVTKYGGHLASGDPSDIKPLRDVHDWLRTHWEHADRLMPSPNTAVIGHSFGATLGAELVAQIPARAFASLSGVFGAARPDPNLLLASIPVPSLCLWNDNDDSGIGASLDNPGDPSPQLWDQLQMPRHAVILQGATHGAYMAPGTGGTCPQGGPCNLVPSLAADFVTAFLTKYMPPEYASGASAPVPESLFVQPQFLLAPPLQRAYAASYFLGFSVSKLSSSSSKASCVAQVLWETSSSGSAYLVPA